jgi:hypothetical protein
MELKNRIEKLLSDILSEKYDCIVRLRFEKADDKKEAKQDERLSA